MPPSSSLSMINEDTVLVDGRFAIHAGGPTPSQSSRYGHGHAIPEQQSLSMASKSQASINMSTGTSRRQPQFVFQSSSRDSAPTMSTPGVGLGSTPYHSPSPSQSPSPVPDVSRLAQTRYARAVQYAHFRNAHDTSVANSSHSVSSSVMSSVQGSVHSASAKPMALTHTNKIITTTRPLKPPSHSASPRIPPPRVKSVPSVPVTPPPPNRTTIPSSSTSSNSPSNNATASTSSNNNSFAQSSADALEWRKHGKRVRAMLLLEDEEKGGSTFQLTNSCSIERYYRVAERVLEKFLSTSIRKNVNELELAESYLVGNRLVKFLSVVLPTHHQYFSNDPGLQALRKRSQEQLVQLLRYLEEIALVMDEFQYNNYILRDLTPEEQIMVKGLTTAGGGSGNVDGGDLVAGNGGTTPNGRSMPLDASMDSTRSAMSVQMTPSPTRSTAVAVSPDVVMDRTRSTPTQDFITPATAKPDSKVSLQERVAQVIQMTEAFSDTYENTSEGKPEAAPHLILKRNLMAVAAGGGAEDTSTITNSLRSSTPNPSMYKANTSAPTTRANQQQRVTSPTLSELSDPSLITLSSDESEDKEGWNEMGWDDSDFPLDNKANLWNLDGATSNSRNQNSIPKLKQPKSRPTRSERARAAAAMQYDQLFTQSQPTRKYSNGTKGRNDGTFRRIQSVQNNNDVPLPPPSEAGMDESTSLIKTRIEDRLERASIVQRELRQHELRKSQTKANQRWRTKSEDRRPLNAMALEDYGDDNSLLQDKPHEVMTNQSILRHFRGCVQCMLD